jgi:hypothetical protein
LSDELKTKNVNAKFYLKTRPPTKLITEITKAPFSMNKDPRNMPKIDHPNPIKLAKTD